MSDKLEGAFTELITAELQAGLKQTIEVVFWDDDLGKDEEVGRWSFELWQLAATTTMQGDLKFKGESRGTCIVTLGASKEEDQPKHQAQLLSKPTIAYDDDAFQDD